MQEEDPGGLIVTILTAEVEWSEASSVLHVHIRLRPAQHGHRLTEAFPARLVESSVAVQLVLVIQTGALTQENSHNTQVSSCSCSLQRCVSSLEEDL